MDQMDVDAADHRRRIESLQRLVLERIVLPYGEAWIAEDDDGRVRRVSPSGCCPTR